MQEPIRIVLTGGVSGGHVFPLLAVAEAVQRKSPIPTEFLFVGSRGVFEENAMQAAGIPMKFVATGKWRRYFSFQNFIDVCKLPWGLVQALWYLLWFMPDAIFSKGGSASVPVVVAAWLYRIPVIVHDSDAKPGASTKFMARFAERVAVAYPGARQYFPADKTAVTGNPVRREMTAGVMSEAIDTFKLHLDKPVVLVLGGSQGARALNEHLLSILPALIEKNFQIIHVTGEANYAPLVQAVTGYGLNIETGPYRPVAFLNAQNLANVYAAAGVVVSRAGAGSIAELAANKKAVILVPLPTAANDHQRANAYEVFEAGGAIVLEEGNLSEHILIENIERILGDQGLRQRMGSALSLFYHPDAADRIAVALLELAVAV
jgi:UDP-N-acetylglucosamine--N-acetylmuramyl-(pentapeptide) pyrophosphoryl-undecaprenol N-acetylglucosamine transferase